jgi:4'-phosphopantetheinyl transferase
MPALNASLSEQEPVLGEGTVHVWHVDLIAAQISIADMFDLLDAGERSRASRLRHASDRAQFMASHGVAKFLLAHYLGCDPRKLRFGYEPRGKPYVLRNEEEPDLRFNVSRTTNFALFAVAKAHDVGVDIEQIAQGDGLGDVVLRGLSHRERARMETLESETEKEAQFFRAWTRKEAFLKARGDGLSIAPADVDTADDSGKIYVRGQLQPGWRVRDVAVRPGYSAAAAAPSEHWRVIYREFNGLDQRQVHSKIAEGDL